jgi:hypothetical protein
VRAQREVRRSENMRCSFFLMATPAALFFLGGCNEWAYALVAAESPISVRGYVVPGTSDKSVFERTESLPKEPNEVIRAVHVELWAHREKVVEYDTMDGYFDLSRVMQALTFPREITLKANAVGYQPLEANLRTDGLLSGVIRLAPFRQALPSKGG